MAAAHSPLSPVQRASKPATAAPREPGREPLVRLAKAREAKKHDVSDALADLALDEARPLYERQAAPEALATLGNRAVLPRIEPLLGAADPSLRAYAEAAAAALRPRRRPLP